MLGHPQAHSLVSRGTNSDGNDGRRGEFIGDDSTVQLIQKPLSDKQWCGHFLGLRGRLETESSEIPRDTRVSKVFATLRGLCLGPEAMMSLSVDLPRLVLFGKTTY